MAGEGPGMDATGGRRRRRRRSVPEPGRKIKRQAMGQGNPDSTAQLDVTVDRNFVSAPHGIQASPVWCS